MEKKVYLGYDDIKCQKETKNLLKEKKNIISGENTQKKNPNKSEEIFIDDENFVRRILTKSVIE